MYLQIIYSIYIWKQGLASNNQQWLIYHKTNSNYDVIEKPRKTGGIKVQPKKPLLTPDSSSDEGFVNSTDNVCLFFCCCYFVFTFRFFFVIYEKNLFFLNMRKLKKKNSKWILCTTKLPMTTK